MQSPGQTSMILRWRTDVATDSRVRYGVDMNNISESVDEATVTTEHRVVLTGLSPLTTYHYIIGSTTDTLFGPDSRMHFTTAPDTLTDHPIRVWAIGDFGHGSPGQAEVRDSYEDFAANDRPADLWLWLGDNAYQDGTDEEFQTKVFDSIYGYRDLFMNLPFAPTPGNHDYNSICPWQPVLCTENPENHTGPYLDIIDPPTQGELGGVPSNRKIFYSYDYGNVHFVSLNSEIGSFNSSYDWVGLLNSDPNYSSPMLDWLRADLAATTKTWKVLYWHQCPYSGQDNFTEENGVQQFCVASRHHFNPILEELGADVVLTGHDHNFQRSYLINGHYGGKDSFTPEMMINGSSGNAAAGETYVKYKNGPLAGVGTVYVLEGNASSGNTASPIDHPAIYYGTACDTCLGSFIMDVSGDTLNGRYLNSYGQILDDFTIVKTTWNVGIEETMVADERFTTYPNPSADQLTIHSKTGFEGAVTLNVADMRGRQVKVAFQLSNDRLIVDTSRLDAGVYAAKITEKGRGYSVRFVKN